MRTNMLKLYYPPARCALAYDIALQEAGATYTTERLDFKSNQQNSPEYLAVNPKGRVPALITDRRLLGQDPAIRYQRRHPPLRIHCEIFRTVLLVAFEVEPLGRVGGACLLQGDIVSERAAGGRVIELEHVGPHGKAEQ